LSLTGTSSGRHRGLLLAALILLGWLVSLIGLLRCDLASLPWPWLLLAVAARTLLQTGLFIVGHDAMHCVLIPGSRRWNDRLGALSLGLYAALSYAGCLRKHHRHHAHTATVADPDFHPDASAGFLPWYLRFMAGYLTAAQMGCLLCAWGAVALLAGRVSPSGLHLVVLVCVLPLLLSSLQLFGFGPYLPHRGQRLSIPGTAEPRGPSSLELPVWLSLLACYHFGYHLDHHLNPSLAWFELPAQRRRRLALAGKAA